MVHSVVPSDSPTPSESSGCSPKIGTELTLANSNAVNSKEQLSTTLTAENRHQHWCDSLDG